MELADLQALARTAPARYHPYRTGKGRLIDNPDDILKEVQQRVQRQLLRNYCFPSWVQGAVKGRSILTNADLHCRQRVIIKIDVKACFPSITPHMIFEVWRNTLDMSPPVASLLTKLTTFRGRLPQGAPTSPALANLVLLAVDGPIVAQCTSENWTFTRWIDDFVISGDAPTAVIATVVASLRARGFRVSRRKLEIRHGGLPQQVTGYLVNGTHPSVARDRRDQVKAATSAIPGGSRRNDFLKSLDGRIGFLKQTNPGTAKALRRRVAKELALKSGRKSAVVPPG